MSGDYPTYPATGYAFAAYASHDPLVADRSERFEGWWQRVWATVARSWRALVPVTVILTLIPQLVIGGAGTALSIPYTRRMRTALEVNVSSSGFRVPWAALGTVILMAVVTSVALSFFAAAFRAASTRIVVKQANGQAVTTPEALRYGFRNAPRLWGWNLLVLVCVTAGTCACYLPGLYLLVATALFWPIALFERGESPIGGSVSLVNRNFGAALGRIALAEAPAFVLGVVIGGLSGAFGGLTSSAAVSETGSYIQFGVSAVIAPVLTVVTTIATIITYAQMRARSVVISSAWLLATITDQIPAGYVPVFPAYPGTAPTQYRYPYPAAPYPVDPPGDDGA